MRCIIWSRWDVWDDDDLTLAEWRGWRRWAGLEVSESTGGVIDFVNGALSQARGGDIQWLQCETHSSAGNPVAVDGPLKSSVCKHANFSGPLLGQSGL